MIFVFLIGKANKSMCQFFLSWCIMMPLWVLVKNNIFAYFFKPQELDGVLSFNTKVKHKLEGRKGRKEMKGAIYSTPQSTQNSHVKCNSVVPLDKKL